jgi:Ca-activated chloride channel homolog
MRSRALFVVSILVILTVGARRAAGQADRRPDYRANVNLVEVTFSVTDSKGKLVGGLRAEDVRILEDEVPQKIAFFAEGGRPSPGVTGNGPDASAASVFILFDTSNGMYNAFPYLHDSISDFIRRLSAADSVAIYTFSRNLFRAAPLTRDHEQARAGLYNSVAGDDAALFNAVLLTLRDAAKVPGRKSIVVFSNGRDNASMVSPGDVGRVAEDEGIPIYLISTPHAGSDQMMAGALESLAGRTGGKVYWVRNSKQQAGAFVSVREDIEASYVASYYPALNPNEGFRRIKVEVIGPEGKTYQIRARSGYHVRRQGNSLTN